MSVAETRAPTRGRHQHMDALVDQLLEAQPGVYRGLAAPPSVHSADLRYADGTEYQARRAMLYLWHQYEAVRPTSGYWRRTSTWVVNPEGLRRYMRGERTPCALAAAGECPCCGAFPSEREL